MTFGLPQTRYATDSDGRVYDTLVEYAIDVICGQVEFPQFYNFAINRVFREYLYSLGDNLDTKYLPVPIYCDKSIGVYFDKHCYNYMDDVWYYCVPFVGFRVTVNKVYSVNICLPKSYRIPAMSSGPVPEIAIDMPDVTFTLACLLLCRQIALYKLGKRFRRINDQGGLQRGKDKAEI